MRKYASNLGRSKRHIQVLPDSRRRHNAGVFPRRLGLRNHRWARESAGSKDMTLASNAGAGIHR